MTPEARVQEFTVSPFPIHKQFVNLSDREFGRLRVVSFAGMISTGKRRHACWNCTCSCGNLCPAIRGTHLTESSEDGKGTSSCGCLSRDSLISRSTTHGHSAGGTRSPTYISYAAMLQRVFDENCAYHKNYGGRGISIDARWLGVDGFLCFMEDMGERPKGMSIDRRENSGDYCKSNCKWSTPTEQQRNRRNTVMVDFHGQPTPLAEIAERHNIPLSRLRSWIKRGLSIEKTIGDLT